MLPFSRGYKFGEIEVSTAEFKINKNKTCLIYTNLISIYLRDIDVIKNEDNIYLILILNQ